MYCGSVGPVNQFVFSGATVGWESDGYTQEQGWRLCYSTEAVPTTSPTTSPTPAPTAPALPDRTSLSTVCSVHVSSTNGTDSDACGEASETPCHSIQKGIERAGNYNTVCVHEGELPKQHCAYSQLTMYLQVAIVVGLVGQEPSHEASCCAALMQ